MEIQTTANLQPVPVPAEGQAGTAQSADGVFAQLLLQLFGGTMGGETSGYSELLYSSGAGSNPSGADSELPGESKPDLYALQMAALGILAPEPGAVSPALPADADAVPVSALPGISLQGAAENQFPVAGQRQSAGGGDAPGGPSFSVTAYEETVPRETANLLREQTPSFEGAEVFRKAVSEAKKALAAEPDKPQAPPPDVEALQQKADQADVSTLSAAKEKLPANQSELVRQVKTQILQNRADEKNEFVVKLKPESLGEITIRLQEREGKITLSIVTASAQTAKLLNESADALRMSLHPLQAEVREIVSRPGEPTQSPQGGWSGGSFESFQQQYSGHRAHTPQAQSGYAVIPEPEPPEGADALLTSKGLNAYI